MKAAEYGCNVGVSVSEQEERRTGAGVFAESGTVGDDPLVFGEIEFRGIGFKLAQLDVDRAWNMTVRECLCASYVDNNGCSIIECSFCIFDSYTWKIGFSESHFARWHIKRQYGLSFTDRRRNQRVTCQRYKHKK